MGAADLDPVSCALFLLSAFTIAGVAQTAWFRSPASRPLMLPLDAGLTLGGRRLLGANKTVRGFVGMVPAAAGTFAGLAALAGPVPLREAGLWRLSPIEYGALGALAGFGFMAGELPNSFLKRRLGIPEGHAHAGVAAATTQFLADRLDSGIGMLVAMNTVVTVPPATWVVVLTIGPLIHWGFSVAMYHLGIKPRPA